MGQAGGGIGAFIGEVHRKAARMDGYVQMTAGAFDIDPQRSLEQGKILGLDPKRVYTDYKTMLKAESALPKGERVDFVSICTPNFTHYPIATACLEAGFNVMCEKPMTMTVDEAVSLQKLVRKTGLTFGLLHTYTGYPMVKLARDIVKAGDLGRIRKVVVQYPQGWLGNLAKTMPLKAAWRTDPKQSDASCCMGDIGTHAANLAEYITGLKITSVLADLSTYLGGKLDDDGNVLLRMEKGVKGALLATQVGPGEENNLHIWVYGDKKSLCWYQENPNYLRVLSDTEPEQVWKRGNPYVAAKSPSAGRCTRTPCGHPEAFLEAFANHYKNFTDTIRAKELKKKPTALELDFPTVEDGVRGMKFVAAVVESSKKGNVWIRIR
ncbi:MAG: Gfo/Idh/MocA family oxidoreductase [Kiritimatiellae bacterium]|nr:Gfo/Idh/MocA family oxidoreductase [Kiritimatiellia bacterium]